MKTHDFAKRYNIVQPFVPFEKSVHKILLTPLCGTSKNSTKFFMQQFEVPLGSSANF